MKFVDWVASVEEFPVVKSDIKECTVTAQELTEADGQLEKPRGLAPTWENMLGDLNDDQL